MRPTVYLVGAGPGDVDLVTVKGYELIKKADCIVYDHLANPVFFKCVKEGCELVYVGKKAGAHTMTQDNINRLLVRKARKNHIVVRLKGGDPFIFGRGAEEAAFLGKNKIDFEIVPGVTSAIAVPAYAGIPLTERSMTSSVGFITGHEDPTKGASSIDWEALVKGLGTMVFLMGIGNLEAITEKLVACGKPGNTPVALIQEGTTAKQRTVTGTLKNIARKGREKKISAPAIIVVGETVRLRNALTWFETKPLFAKKVVVTRTREQASVLSSKLSGMGADVIEVPTIEIVPIKADAKLRRAFSGTAYDWVFFTSCNGVNEFRKFLARNGKDSRIFGRGKVCAIGTETGAALRAIGIRPDYIPPSFVAEEIVKHFGKKCGVGLRALVLSSAIARCVLPLGLKRAGFEVEMIDLYDTVIPKGSKELIEKALDGGVDMVTFTSSSTVVNFLALLGKNYKRALNGVKFASIGPVTSGALKRAGLKPHVEAKTYTIDGLVDAINSCK
ncbi:MAG: uroporphyrinogen-III C-methyltransferase [Candidatus Omnitrophica bacterium]|nr:uroporphyrinogen-III C-methyltransferase [Candidatus Omnitrophota bacterium]